MAGKTNGPTTPTPGTKPAKSGVDIDLPRSAISEQPAKGAAEPSSSGAPGGAATVDASSVAGKPSAAPAAKSAETAKGSETPKPTGQGAPVAPASAPPAAAGGGLAIGAAALLGALCGIIGGGVAAYVLAERAPAVDPARLGALETSIARLAAAPKPADTGPLDKRLAGLEETVSALRGADGAIGPNLEERLAALDKAQAERVARAETALTNLSQKLDALDKAVPSLAERPAAEARAAVAAIQGTIGEVKAGFDAVKLQFAALEGAHAVQTARLLDVEKRLRGIEPQVGGLLGELAPRVETLNQSVGLLEARSRAPEPTQMLAAVTATARAFERGEALGPALSALSAAKVTDEKLAALRVFAEKPAPSAGTLRAEFEAAVAKLPRKEAALPADAGMLDRLKAGALSLVEVRTVGEVSGSDDAALVARARGLLAASDLAGAAELVGTFTPGGQAIMKEWAGRARARAMAEAALRDLEREATARAAEKR